MYLKSLVLKGFKSFADRSVLALEPGITAVVGPNGSGKSNISDAVLWVLGERSARNLRGQAMEDIIFSGSAARRAVSVAEVSLVLDNSDHVLPVDFDEVTITRRMYRSGESEYLVNGVVARRLDVLDILHDTGLGTGTHSIISQGSLDSILQSRPEDRRALIEEAAGVLKHKQRKEKSARKLAAMDGHLARVGDVVAEITRQLRPLERKAKRAEAFKVASAELVERRLALAVDDLRALQREWDAACQTEQAAEGRVEGERAAVAEAERKVNELQEVIRQETQDAGELARKQRRASSLSERLDNVEVRVRERRRAALGSRADLQAALESAASRRAQAVRELEVVGARLAEAKAASEQANRKAAELADERARADGERGQAEAAVQALEGQLRACEAELDEAKRKQDGLQEALSGGVAQVKLLQARRSQLDENLEAAQAERDQAAKALEAAQEALSDIEAREQRAQNDLVARFEERDRAHADRDAAREAVRLAEAEMKAIEQAQLAARSNDPALRWVLDDPGRFSGTPIPFAKSFRVSASLEALVEMLLAEDLAALSVDDAACAHDIARALAEGCLAGDVSVVLRDDPSSFKRPDARASGRGVPLVDELEYSADDASVVEALLGDVVVCDDRESAFAAHAADDVGLRFLSRDGCALWPNGKVRIFGAREDGDEGVIARERRLSDLAAGMAGLQDACAKAEAAAAAADEAYREMQVESLKLSQQLANSQGACDAARDVDRHAQRKLESAERERAEADRNLAQAEEVVGGLRPDLDAVLDDIGRLSGARAQLAAERDERTAQVAPLRDAAARAAEQLSEAKLAAATLAERLAYDERVVAARQADIRSFDDGAAEQRRTIAVKGVVADRGEELLALVGEIARNLSRRVAALDEALAQSESSTSGTHGLAAAARDAARAAHEGYDAASAALAQARIEKSKLEVRVEAAVSYVTSDLGTPIDRAQQLPQLEDRAAVEDEVFKLERRIKNMGAINPDAAREYAELKERYDYLAGQLADMEAARKSLKRIVKVIDARMKDDFVNTFRQVNENFNEIFSLLFPGGAAYLSFDDPDDIENTGVEVTAQPRGKRLTKMLLMSGGEKSLTALALLFAVYKTRATPFYILDEVEAALDDTNLRRLTSYIDSLRQTTQLIMITHQRRTMEMADVLFGVSMQADGVTKVVSQKLERALEHSE